MDIIARGVVDHATSWSGAYSFKTSSHMELSVAITANRWGSEKSGTWLSVTIKRLPDKLTPLKIHPFKIFTNSLIALCVLLHGSFRVLSHGCF